MTMKKMRGSKDKRPEVLIPHAQTPEEVCAFFDVDPNEGLGEEDVLTQRKSYGMNKLDEEENKSLFALILEQFEDLLVRILLIAAIVSFLLAYFEGDGEEGITAYVEPIVILIILIANAFVGVYQEQNAENALAALRKLQPEVAMVLRESKWEKINAEELVPGDIVEIRTGDRVPADMRVLQLKTTSLRLEQSQLTGESQSVSKESDIIFPENSVIQAKVNMVFSSTSISNGSAICCVTNTGMKTEIGHIQLAVKEAGEDEEKTPLQQKLDDFGNLLAKVIFVICAVVWLINYNHFFDPVHGSVFRGCIYYFKIAIALAVAAIPEGLPAVITTCLALGTRKMAQRNCIVRKLPSVETLGCTTVICSDKTGTLTTNEMCAIKFAVPGSASELAEFDVDGYNYTPYGKINNDFKLGKNDIGLHAFAKIGCLCNESRISIGDDGRVLRTGEPTEAALRVLVEKMGCLDEALNKKILQKEKRTNAEAQGFSNYWARDFTKYATLEFTRDRKSMSVIGRNTGSNGNTLYVKGAPESILERCDSVMLPDGSVVKLSAGLKKKIVVTVESMAKQALRTIAFAQKTDLGKYKDYNGAGHKTHKDFNPDNFVNIEQGLIFVGLVGILDPPRPECKDAIAECRRAGIAVVMITGDNKLTAEAISAKLGIIKSTDAAEKSFTGSEFDQMDDSEKQRVLKRMVTGLNSGGVFSRTEPKHKQQIVKILSQIGEIAAMTGDGVNDAPALKQASIGIAMGISGTEVAKEASAMVLTDDNFSTIVAAVEEGRSIYNNMKAFIRYLISSNIGEVASIFFTAALGIPEGLTPVQLLWVNLVTDGPPATALGFNPPDVNAMRKPPRRKDDMLISGWVFFRYMVIGIYVGFATVGIFIYWFTMDQFAPDGHTLVSLEQLMDWGHCTSDTIRSNSANSIWSGFNAKSYSGLDFSTDPCSYFRAGKVKASTLSLTVLVVIEMLNAFNALSEDGSLLQMPPWKNIYLIIAVCGATAMHFVILYIPWLAKIFNVCPLEYHDWMLVMYFSFPVILIDEILKFFGRITTIDYYAKLQKLEKAD